MRQKPSGGSPNTLIQPISGTRVKETEIGARKREGMVRSRGERRCYLEQKSERRVCTAGAWWLAPEKSLGSLQLRTEDCRVRLASSNPADVVVRVTSALPLLSTGAYSFLQIPLSISSCLIPTCSAFKSPRTFAH